VASGLSERADGPAHGLVGHANEAVGDFVGGELLGVALLGVPLVDRRGQFGKSLLGALFVERLLLRGTKDLGEVVRQEATWIG
jgi:hypothetical protein